VSWEKVGPPPEEDLPELASLEEFSSYVPLRVAVLTRLKAAILDGTLKPGLILSENKIASQLSVSRTPVRDALRVLEQENLVTILPGRKVIVSIPTLKDINEIYDIRWILESEGLRRIRPDDKDLIQRMERSVNESWLFLKSGNLQELKRNNTEFHTALISALNNSRIRQFLESVYDTTERLRLYSIEEEGWAKESVKEHGELVTLLKAGDRKAALAMLKRHLSAAKEVLINMFCAQEGIRKPERRDSGSKSIP
jgi:DNA-binding GntR family transcriptional regulator